jgi:hypothetical protein
MAKVLSLKQALKGWLFMAAAVVAILFGSQLAERLMRDPGASAEMRWLGVFIAVVATIPWLFVIVRAIGNGDEYVRQVALVGTAFAFVVDLLVHIAYSAAQDARFVSWGRHLLPLPMAMGVWLLGVTIAALYYRFRP